jgi:hypothetical protein
MNNDHNQSNDDARAQASCTRTFEIEETQVTNSYLCNQRRYTFADSWNLLKQKRQFSRTV